MTQVWQDPRMCREVFDAIITAMMLNECAVDVIQEPELEALWGASAVDLACAAGSYMQVAYIGKHSWDGAEAVVARIHEFAEQDEAEYQAAHANDTQK